MELLELNIEQCLKSTKAQGFCVAKNVFSNAEIERINRSVNNYLLASHDGIVYEKDSSFVRAIHGLHLFDPFFMELAKHKFLIDFSQQYLSDDVYIHQYKINMKSAMEGQSWPWHQDYIYWKEGDYIETPQLLNVAIALDNISMLSGPLCVIPKSHRFGDLTKYDGVTSGCWSKDVSSDLTYKIDKNVVASLISDNGYEFLICNAGDVIFFDPQLAHASSNNLSPFERRLLLVTYNAVSNAPIKKSKRPVFLSAVDFTPITFNPEESSGDDIFVRGVV